MGSTVYTNPKQASIFDIGRIDHQIKKMLQLHQIMGLVDQHPSIKEIECANNQTSSVVIHTKSDSSIDDIRFIVSSILLNVLEANQVSIFNVLQALGYTTIDDYFNLVINRVNMLYTVLQISSNQFALILV